jgi:hypothetical protein
LTNAVAVLTALAAIAAGPQVTVKPLTGVSVKGALAHLAGDKVTLDTPNGPQTLAAAELMWVEFPAAASPSKPSVWIELLDGSKLLATAYSTAAGKAQVELTSGQAIEIQARLIRHVRFREQQTPELVTQWREILASPVTGDMVVVRKKSTRTVEQGDNEPMTVTEEALDQLEGTIHSVGPDSVQFEFDGEKIDVRREKLDGLVYYQPAKREFSQPLCRLIDAGGSAWSLRDVQLAAGQLKGATIGGVALELPLTAVAKVDFSIGNVTMLADLEPDSGDGDLGVSLQPAAMAHKFGSVFKLRTSPPLGADAFRIAGLRYDGGLSLHSPLTLVYRVPAGFRWLRATAGVDDSVVAPGRFELIILGDGKELLRKPFDGQSPRTAVPIDLDVSGVRRISIVLDPADGQDFGDQLNLVDARFTK